MAIDYSRILSTLNNSRFQKENNAAYQAIKDLILAVQKNLRDLEASISLLEVEELLNDLVWEGDVAGGPSESPITLTIQPHAVTYAKMQEPSTTSVILGRGTGGSSDVREINLGTGLSFSGDTISASGSGNGVDPVARHTLLGGI